jgi:hypothetical protein
LWNALGVLNFVNENFATNSDYYPDVYNGTQLYHHLQIELDKINAKYPFFGSEISSVDFQSNLTGLLKLGTFNGNSENDTESFDIMNFTYYSLVSKAGDLFDIEVSQASNNISQTEEEIFKAFFDWYIAFFVAAGCVLLLLALARYVGHESQIPESDAGIGPRRSSGKRAIPGIAITLQCIIGIGMAFVSLLAKWQNSNSFENFLGSPWIIPTVLLAFSLGKWFP